MSLRSLLWFGALAVFQIFPVCVRALTNTLGAGTSIAGEQKEWHKVSLTFTGPYVAETDSTNPFRNYRLNVTFTHTASKRSLLVPGYFAADGNAANTSAAAGNKWRVEFAPDATGSWTYTVSFRKGTDVAISTSPSAGSGTDFDGSTGSFTVDATDKTGADFRGKGRLQEVGQHYLKYLGSGEYFVKSGVGSPENFLAYADFDNTKAGRKILHRYAPHLKDFHPGDPTWKGSMGKGIIGALNYLASKGMNSVYFLTMNVGGDGDDVFPYSSKTDVTRFDVSKLAQWEIVFEHMDQLGILLHVVTQETENDQLLDGGALGVQRKLYYRELIARFGHHLGVIWNLGEENTNTAAQREAFASYINALDPYFHLITVHTFPKDRDSIYGGLIGNALIHGASLQLETPSIVHVETLKWVSRSAAAGDKWFVALDEIGPAGVGVMPDANDPQHSDIVHRALWGHLMAGGGGMEWYFGYNYANDDLTCEDWRSRDRMFTFTRYAADFFRTYLPLPLVENYDGLTASTVDYCLGKPGVAYAIYLPAGATTTITLPAGEAYSIDWFNPRTGGSLTKGTVASVPGGTAAVGRPLTETTLDWVALLRRNTTAGGGSSVPPPPPPAGSGIAQLTLINTSTQRDLRALNDGDTITLSRDGVNLNVRADVTGAVGSVTFAIDGKVLRTENVVPYALAGDDTGNYHKWTPPVGTHTLRVVPYQSQNARGAMGEPTDLTLHVVN